jgi:hypothetical protein
MGIGETIIIYLVVGVGISLALVSRADNKSRSARAYLAIVGFIFWPIFLPTLIAAKRETLVESPREINCESNVFLARISKIEDQLNSLLINKDGWAARVLANEADRIRSFIAAMRSQSQRVGEMAQLLSELNSKSPTPLISGDDEEKNPEGKHNTDSLRQLHQNAERDLWRTIEKTEELITMIYVARFAGGSRSEMEELLVAISSTVESISAVAGQQVQ